MTAVEFDLKSPSHSTISRDEHVPRRFSLDSINTSPSEDSDSEQDVLRDSDIDEKNETLQESVGLFKRTRESNEKPIEYNSINRGREESRGSSNRISRKRSQSKCARFDSKPDDNLKEFSDASGSDVREDVVSAFHGLSLKYNLNNFADNKIGLLSEKFKSVSVDDEMSFSIGTSIGTNRGRRMETRREKHVAKKIMAQTIFDLKAAIDKLDMRSLSPVVLEMNLPCNSDEEEKDEEKENLMEGIISDFSTIHLKESTNFEKPFNVGKSLNKSNNKNQRRPQFIRPKPTTLDSADSPFSLNQLHGDSKEEVHLNVDFGLQHSASKEKTDGIESHTEDRTAEIKPGSADQRQSPMWKDVFFDRLKAVNEMKKERLLYIPPRSAKADPILETKSIDSAGNRDLEGNEREEQTDDCRQFNVNLVVKKKKSIRRRRRRNAVFEKKVDSENVSNPLIDDFIKESLSSVFLEKVQALFNQNRYFDVIICCMAHYITDRGVYNVLGSSLLKLGLTDFLEVYLDLNKKSVDVDENLLQSMRRSQNLHMRIKNRLLTAANSNDIRDNLSNMKLFLKELKTIESRSMSHDLYNALFLTLKIVSYKKKQNVNSDDNELLIRKMKDNIKLCLECWFGSLTDDLCSLCLHEQFLKASPLNLFVVVKDFIHSLIVIGSLAEVAFISELLLTFSQHNLLIGSTLSRIYEHLSPVDIITFAKRKFDEMELNDVPSIPNLECNLVSIKNGFNEVNQALTELFQTCRDIKVLSSEKEKAKSLFVAGKTTEAQLKYSEILESEYFRIPIYKCIKSVLLTNRAACYLKLCKFQCAVDDCTEAIDLDGMNYKAKIRLAKSLAKQHFFDKALFQLKTTLQEHPEQNHIVSLLSEIAREKELFLFRKKKKEALSRDSSQMESDLTVEDILKTNDLYKIFGVERIVEFKEIKKSYHKLALKYHPDKVAADASMKQKYEDVFKKISSSFQILKDPVKRRAYDLKQRSLSGHNYSSTSSSSPSSRYRTYGSSNSYGSTSYYTRSGSGSKFSKQYSYSGYG